jgi:hypothetical protein
MAKVTYLNPDGSAPDITWMGVDFAEGKSVTVDNEALLQKAANNPSFKVSGSSIKPEPAAAQEAPSTDPTPPTAATWGSSAVINAADGDQTANAAPEPARRGRPARD